VTLVDVMVSYQLHRLRFALNAQNLFDKEYVAGCSGGSCYYGRALTMYGSTTYAW
jgi:iron complex outermembrane receptor protein